MPLKYSILLQGAEKNCGRTKKLNTLRKLNKLKKKLGLLNRSCLVYKPWFSYISYVFHGAVKARGNPQCLQPLLNITRFGTRGHILWLGQLLEEGGVREERTMGLRNKEKKKRGRKEV